MKKLFPRGRGDLLAVLLFLILSTTLLFSIVYKVSENIFLAQYLSDLEGSVHRLGDDIKAFVAKGSRELEKTAGIIDGEKRDSIDWGRFLDKTLEKIDSSRRIELLIPSGKVVAYGNAPILTPQVSEELSEAAEKEESFPTFLGIRGKIYGVSRVQVSLGNESYFLRAFTELSIPTIFSQLKVIPQSMVMIKGGSYKAVLGDSALGECSFCHETSVSRGLFTIPHQGFIKKGGYLLSNRVGRFRFAFLPFKEANRYSSYLLLKFDSDRVITSSRKIGRLILLSGILMSISIVFALFFLFRRQERGNPDIPQIVRAMEEGRDWTTYEEVSEEMRPLLARVMSLREELEQSRKDSGLRIQNLLNELEDANMLGTDSVSRLQSINGILSAIHTIDNTEGILGTVMRRIRSLIPCKLLIFAVNETSGFDEQDLVILLHSFRDDSISEIFFSKIRKDFPAFALKFQDPRIVEVEEEAFFEPYAVFGHGLSSALVYPLNVNGKNIGVLSFFRQAGSSFSDVEMESISLLAMHLARALENKRIHEGIKKNYFIALKAIVDQFEERDRYMKGHSERVCSLSLAMGKKAGLSKKRLSNLYRAAALHDVGKIGVDLSIINKRRKLSEEEKKIVSHYHQRGEQIIEPLDFLGEVKECIRQYYANSGSKGCSLEEPGREDLSLEGKILAVADAFDAMTSDRPFRKAMSYGEAMNELAQNSYMQFDSQVVKLFMEVHDEMRVARQYRNMGSESFSKG